MNTFCVMKATISFPDWSDALTKAPLDDNTKQRHRVIINWFLGHLKREGARASVETGRGFLNGLIESRRPEDWSRKGLRPTRS